MKDVRREGEFGCERDSKAKGVGLQQVPEQERADKA
jgi:hypothetical protein